MSDLITYDDKIRLKSQNVSDKYKVTAEDMNEIKRVANSHAEDIDEANNNITDLNNNKLDSDAILNQASTDTNKTYSANYLNDKLVSVGATAPENDERVWFKKSRNLFDKSTATLEKAVSTSNGNLYNESSSFATDFIEVKTGGVYYTTSGYSTSANRVYGAQYDSNKQYIGGIVTNAESKTFYISNASTKYIRLTGFISDIDTYQLEESSTAATTYEPYTETSIYVDGKEWFNSNNTEKYSTNEIKLGTWIDGKPIYRKVLTYTLTLDNNNYNAYTSEADLIKSIDALIDFRFFVYNGTLIFVVPNGGGTNSNRDAGTYIQRSYGGIGFQASSYSRNNYNNTTAVVVLEYTKTTD